MCHIYDHWEKLLSLFLYYYLTILGNHIIVTVFVFILTFGYILNIDMKVLYQNTHLVASNANWMLNSCKMHIKWEKKYKKSSSLEDYLKSAGRQCKLWSRDLEGVHTEKWCLHDHFKTIK